MSSADQAQPDKASTPASAEAPVAETAGSSTAAKSQPELPPLSPQEFRAYNRLAETMDYFHDHFRKSWKLLYTAASTGKRPAGMTLRQFIDEGISLVRYLETHHGIEESYFFPLLAKKMPEFRPGKGNGAAELLQQHKQIHAGMDVFEEYLRKCRSGETELELSVMKEKMDMWGDVLLKHLDQEVKTLGAENMRRYWTIAEVRAMPI
ncbi:hypothetical protein BR93DRAFT_966333 [Coniochaeta sp. PMI_546]|nr:hypothetical protein BR93DRAFT_966333 [Coniochaeta sp. PMI_546]